MNYHPDIVLMMYRKEHPDAEITLAKIENYDANLFGTNDTSVTNACVAAGVTPDKFNRSRVLGFALLALGSAGRVRKAANDYKKALDEGVIG